MLNPLNTGTSMQIKYHDYEECVMFLASEGNYIFDAPPVVAESDRSIINSLGKQLGNGNAFTEKQSSIGIRLVNKYEIILKHAGFDVDKIIKDKVFRWPFRTIDKTKTLYIDGEKIVIKSPFIAEVINKIKKRKNGYHVKGNYNSETKEWSFDYNETNLMFLVGLTKGMNFSIDQKIQDDLAKCIDITKDALEHYPMLRRKMGGYTYKDILIDHHKADVRRVVMKAKLQGCMAYDDTVVDLMKPKKPIDKILLGDNRNWFINSMKYTVLDIFPLIETVDKCIIMCSSNEPNDLMRWVDTLVECGIDNKDISVMFRFKSGEKWFDGNKYIKSAGVNEFSEDKKIYIINEKVPKPLIKSNIDPELIISSLPVVPSHYKTQAWLQNKPTVVYYCGSSPSGVENCADL